MRVVLIITATALLAFGSSGPATARSGPVTAVLAVRSAGQATAPSGESEVRYRPPVDAPVSDPFRPPSGPYGPGNRGLEYATSPGSHARAVGDGVVSFSGSVAGRWVVSIVHPDGLRSSLTGLASTSVQVGDSVACGDVVGVTNASLHLGFRRGEEYIDPSLLFADGEPPRHAVLVPVPR